MQVFILFLKEDEIWLSLFHQDVLTQDIYILHVYCKFKKKKWPNLILITICTTVNIFNVYIDRGVLSIDCGV